MSFADLESSWRLVPLYKDLSWPHAQNGFAQNCFGFELKVDDRNGFETRHFFVDLGFQWGPFCHRLWCADREPDVGGTKRHWKTPAVGCFFLVLLGANKISHWARFHGRLQRHDAACPECLGGTWRCSVSRRLPVDRNLFKFCKLMLDGRSFGRIG